ncbi:MAG: hypothetical protein ACUVTR_02075 [Dehalococcoidia bacterium]
MAKRIIFYTAKNGGCTPCEEITKLVEAGKFHSPVTDEVDLVDITTDEGFQQFYDEILSKQDGGVPSAYLDGKKCLIALEDGVVHFECPGSDEEGPSNVLPSSPDEKSSPREKDASRDASQLGPPSEPPSLQS